MDDYEVKRKEIIGNLIKEAKMLKKEDLLEDNMMLTLIEITLEDNEKYFIKGKENYAQQIKNASIEIMGIIKNKLLEEDNKDVER